MEHIGCVSHHYSSGMLQIQRIQTVVHYLKATVQVVQFSLLDKKYNLQLIQQYHCLTLFTIQATCYGLHSCNSRVTLM